MGIQQKDELLTTEEYILYLNTKDKHMLPAKDLANILLNLNEITLELQKQYLEIPNIEIMIKPIQKGSIELIFEFCIELGQDVVQVLNWASDSEQKRWWLEKFGLAFGSFFTVDKAFKIYEQTHKDTIKIQEKDDEISTYTNVKGELIEIPTRVANIYKNSNLARQAIGEIYAIVDNNNDIKDMSLLYSEKREPIFTSSKEEFALLMTHKEELTKTDQLQFEYFNKEELTASDLSYYSKRKKWKMIWNGQSHNFDIEKEIREKMQELRIGKKDKIIVDITVTKKYNKELDVFVRNNYTITYFYKEILFEESILPFS